VTTDPLPFLDAHERAVAASQEQTWAALRQYVDRLIGSSHQLVTWVLGTVPRNGFEVSEEDPPTAIALEGRHRFATYRLVFQVSPEKDGTTLRALSYARFPGLRGTAYRTMLMRSTGHVRGVRHMLRAIADRAER
jgi:hypothetical protein